VSEVRVLCVGAEDAARRLDLFLAERLGLSRAQVRRLLERGAVRVGGRAVRAGAKGSALAEGARVEVAPFARPGDERALADAAAPLAILASGPGWLAVDKPAGTPVHPLAEDEPGTLLGAVAARHPEIHGVGEGGLRSGVVHRLDVDTSGVVLFATSQERWLELRECFALHRVEKRYRAVVLGHVAAAGEVSLGLVTARHRPARVRVVDPHERARGVRAAQLAWRRLEAFGPPGGGASLVEVRPRTGHLHQIRVTLAHLGHPVAGDRVYGRADDPTRAARQMLHAAGVRAGPVAAESPDPADFAALCADLAR
jgi:23S rRNA pseudouridine1911/1915/1917 synthase